MGRGWGRERERRCGGDGGGRKGRERGMKIEEGRNDEGRNDEEERN